MGRRKEKKTKKYRGHRSQGGGNVKNRRGSGNRGGFGGAGLNKHRKTWTVKFDPDHFGKHGFSNPTKTEVDVLNLFEIENMVKAGKLENKEGKFILKFEGKILGTGNITVPVSVSAHAWSKKAEDKIKQSGGQLERINAS
ncbi:uL15 family ribosomal protein [Candidatus Micrarchaeota archaeon]|nr:uL15 family ribosomal protein [Candidatus Micrarchaeota archaeon]